MGYVKLPLKNITRANSHVMSRVSGANQLSTG